MSNLARIRTLAGIPLNESKQLNEGEGYISVSWEGGRNDIRFDSNGRAGLAEKLAKAVMSAIEDEDTESDDQLSDMKGGQRQLLQALKDGKTMTVKFG